MGDDEHDRLTRRQLLQAGLVSGLAGVAGCKTFITEGTETPTTTPSGSPRPTDTATDTPTPTDGTDEEPSTPTSPTETQPEDQQTDTETPNPDPPSIQSFTASPTQREGQIRVTVSAESNGAPATVVASTSDETQSETFDAETLTFETTLAAPPGGDATITVQVTDDEDQTVESSASTYVRASTIPEDKAISFGAKYLVAPRTEQGCQASTPEAGHYATLSESRATKHADALSGAGISHITIPIDSEAKIDLAERFLNSSLGSTVSIQFRYQFLRWSSRDVSLSAQTQAIKQAIESISTYDTHDGRPVVVLPELESLGNRDQVPVWDELISTHGSPSNIIEAIRSELTIDGTEPFLIGETSAIQLDWVHPYFYPGSQLDDTLQQFDAVQNGLLDPAYLETDQGGPDAVEDDWLTELETRIRRLRQYAEKYDLEFVPRIPPGIITSFRGCPPEKHLQRGTERFASLLRYATRYATTTRVTIDSFNDWGMGTQIESGTALGTDYGDSYLQRVREISQDPPPSLQSTRSVYHIDPEGANWNSGSETAPLASIQEGILRAGPGDTVEVHAGEYEEHVTTVRDGQSNNPITISGSEDAIVRVPDGPSFWIKNSHIRLRGITLNGLLDPSRPDQVESYSEGPVFMARPPDDTDTYLEDINIAPAGIGNAQRALITIRRSRNVEIGPMRIIGLAGAKYNVADARDHVGEFIYLGQPARVIEGREHENYNWSRYPWQGELDNTRDVHIHHIDNSAGHLHSEFVDAKTGTQNVLVEYCTDGGGSNNTEPMNPCADVRLHSTEATVRWCDFQNGDERGVHVTDHSDFVSGLDDPVISPDEVGTNNSIYGNRIVDFGKQALAFDRGADAQGTICGNTVTPPTQGTPEQSCPADIPTSSDIGHLAGDSPWTE